jgi:restriction endonuclease Mrr
MYCQLPSGLRGILGVVSDGKSTNGVCVTTSNFTFDARQYAKRNPQLTLFSGKELVSYLDEYFGVTWHLRIDRLIWRSEARAYKPLAKVSNN